RLGMSKEPAARGIGPFRPVAGRAWARDFTSRKEAGLAGEACRGTGPKAGKPTVTRGRFGCDLHRGMKQSSTDDDGGSLSRHCFISQLVFELQSAAGPPFLVSSSSMSLPFFPLSFQTPQIGHACTELLDKKTNKIRKVSDPCYFPVLDTAFSPDQSLETLQTLKPCKEHCPTKL
ncbi:hypothetical protein HID58_034234, partial [Brassica napus]